jgi:spore germination cell wall hydrolase CwlJ-like protein
VKATPEYYREQARVSRVLANRVRDKAIKTHLLKVAEQYERLAGEAAATKGR